MFHSTDLALALHIKRCLIVPLDYSVWISAHWLIQAASILGGEKLPPVSPWLIIQLQDNPRVDLHYRRLVGCSTDGTSSSLLRDSLLFSFRAAKQPQRCQVHVTGFLCLVTRPARVWTGVDVAEFLTPGQMRLCVIAPFSRTVPECTSPMQI